MLDKNYQNNYQYPIHIRKLTHIVLKSQPIQPI